MGIDGMQAGCDELSRLSLGWRASGQQPDGGGPRGVYRLRHGAGLPTSKSWYHTQIWVTQQRRRFRRQPHRPAYGVRPTAAR
jgi:hypothetical protein